MGRPYLCISQPAGRVQVVVTVRGVVQGAGSSCCAFQGCGLNHTRLLTQCHQMVPALQSPTFILPHGKGVHVASVLTWVRRQALLGGLSIIIVPSLRPLLLHSCPRGDSAVAVEGDCKAGWLGKSAWCHQALHCTDNSMWWQEARAPYSPCQNPAPCSPLWCSPVGPIHCRCFFLETVRKGWREGGRGCSQVVSPQEPTVAPSAMPSNPPGNLLSHIERSFMRLILVLQAAWGRWGQGGGNGVGKMVMKW